MGQIRVGVGGWTYEPWRGSFYPQGLPHARELAHASRVLTSIEINGTYYSTFKPASWRKWRAETPDDFLFSIKASRYCTNRRSLAEAGPSVDRFIGQGLSELGAKLGAINWQLMPTKSFDASEMDAFLSLLPRKVDGLILRHAIEARHESFDTPEFVALAAKHGIAIVRAVGSKYPDIDQATGPGFSYLRLMTTKENVAGGVTPRAVSALASRLRDRAQLGDVLAYFIAGHKAHNPLAAQALIARLSAAREPAKRAAARRPALLRRAASRASTTATRRR